MKRRHSSSSPEASTSIATTQDLKQPPRLVSITNRGTWLPTELHVRLETLKGITPELVNYNSESRYHYLKPYEALFCLETSQLGLYFNELPLSLSEAYHLLLGNNFNRLQEYRVFQYLNRIGYICLPPSRVQDQSCQYLASSNSNLNSYSFDVYRRQSFASKRPRKDQPGYPDHYLRVLNLEKANEGKLICRQSASDNGDDADSMTDNDEFCDKLVIASVDIDFSLSFSQFKTLNSDNHLTCNLLI